LHGGAVLAAGRGEHQRHEPAAEQEGLVRAVCVVQKGLDCLGVRRLRLRAWTERAVEGGLGEGLAFPAAELRVTPTAALNAPAVEVGIAIDGQNGRAVKLRCVLYMLGRTADVAQAHVAEQGVLCRVRKRQRDQRHLLEDCRSGAHALRRNEAAAAPRLASCVDH